MIFLWVLGVRKKLELFPSFVERSLPVMYKCSWSAIFLKLVCCVDHTCHFKMWYFSFGFFFPIVRSTFLNYKLYFIDLKNCFVWHRLKKSFFFMLSTGQNWVFLTQRLSEENLFTAVEGHSDPKKLSVIDFEEYMKLTFTVAMFRKQRQPLQYCMTVF